MNLRLTEEINLWYYYYCLLQSKHMPLVPYQHIQNISELNEFGKSQSVR